MAPASIADLPNELLIDILDQPTFPTEALYFLGLLSRRLNFIALPIYFARTGVDLEAKSATMALTTGRFDPLSALLVYLFLPPTMDKIICSFPHPSCLTIFPFLGQLERVHRFLSRLTAVGAVTLELDNRIEGRCLTVGKDDVLDAWASQYGRLLSCIIDKGCSSLAVINGLHLTETYELHRLQKILPRRLTRLFTGPDPGSGLTFRRDPEWGRADIVLALPRFHDGRSKLTSLDMHSVTLLVPPGLDWTLTVLRKSLITSLAIWMSVMAERPIWSTVLPLIAAAAPNLTSISLIDIHPRNEPAIFAFLAQFPALTDLKLTHVEYFTRTQLKLKGSRALQPFLHLLNLRAPIAIVADLSEFMPAIRSICAIWTSSHSYAGGCDALVRHMTVATNRLALQDLSPRICLLIDTPNFVNTLSDLYWNGGPDRFGMIKGVDTLHIKGLYCPHPQIQEDLMIVHLLSWLPSVEHLMFTTDGTYPGDAIARVVHWLEEGREETNLLKTIEVDGKSCLDRTKEPREADPVQ